MIDSNEREIADVSSLFEESPNKKREAMAPKPLPAASEGDYDLDEVEVSKRTFVPSPEDDRDRASRDRESRTSTAATLGEGRTWSKFAEAWPALFRVMSVFAISAYLAYTIYEFMGLWEAFLVFAIGGTVALVLAYPLFITLERPVRFAPEHAARDYYAALSHAFPHHRRMWLLLSEEARSNPDFSSLSAFRNYWRDEVQKLAGTRMFCPLRFKVIDFKSEKGGGQTKVDVSFRVEITRVGSNTPLATRSVETSVTRGADRMWYLDEGRLKG